MRKYICPFCGKEMHRCGIHHIYICKDNESISDKNEIRLKYLKFNFGEDIDKNIIQDYNNLYSLPMLNEKYGIDNKSILFILELNKINIRSISESANKISIKKYKSTCLQKYGVENISQSEIIKKKKEDTFQNHYGVDNIWKLSDYNKRCAELHPDTHQKHMEKLHKGRDDYFKTVSKEVLEERSSKHYETLVNNGIFNSKLELRLCNVFEDLNISYTRQYHIKGYIHPYDFHLCDTKILIEVNGDFWHANPIIYNENDVVKLPGRPTKAKDIWSNDQKHITKANDNGYKVISIWENDIKNLTDDELSEYVLSILKNI